VEKQEQPKHWDSVKDLFGAALEVEREQRGAFLRDACGSNESLRAEIESLLAAYENSSELSQSPWPAVAETTAPQFIGPYHLLEKLGEGGMGQVWLAEQSAPVRRRVALKLIRGGIYDTGLLQRFQAERQSLAIMDHPAIAKVFDAGTTEAGQPYFVMEYVPGRPITEYCDQKKLGIRERIELFIQVCEGVQHAHQKAIIHRDIKPANILVVEVDGKPRPRIIDFGLAKAITSQAAGETLFTQAGAFLGTPGYMSPEQADPGIQDIDTRTDVYSLGVVFYVLLTGCEPFDTAAWKKLPLHEVLRRLREEDVPTPSTRLSSAHEASAAAAGARGTEPRQLANQLRGDLDWITMKAVEKDRNRRYGTPSELATDLRRYLENEPVVARPASAGYRLQKYVRRHRVAVAFAIIIGALLVTFGVVQAMQLRRITRERDRADRIADFMTGLFKVSNPSERVGGAVTAADLLDKGAKDIDAGLSADPELQARMMYVMGRAYMYLGFYPRAQSLFERGIEVSSSAGGRKSRETLNTMHDLGWTLFEQGKLAEAESLQRKLVDTQRRVLGAEHPDTLASISSLAFTLCEEGKCAEGVKLNSEVLEKQKRVLGPEARYTIVTMDNLAIMLAENRRPAEAETLEKEALAIHLRVSGPDNFDTVNAMINLGEFQRDMGRDGEAMKTFRQTLEIEERIFGPNQPETAVTRYDLASVLARSGQIEDAFPLLRQAVDHGLPPRLDLGVEKDPVLSSLHGDPRFEALVSDARERAAAAQNTK
jgi:non-specific serine/threonine protein kinase/serine/threonine-protein kinase